MILQSSVISIWYLLQKFFERKEPVSQVYDAVTRRTYTIAD